jgi:hypothetical protein
VLPGERWQILATLPASRNQEGHWHGTNLTFYGVLSANAYVLAVAIALILLRSVGVPVLNIIILTISLLAICVPASKLVARIVEGKAHTFTVGGAVFVGIVASPWIIELMNMTIMADTPLPIIASLTVLSIAYAFGEGLGRLACISFGCCYGKPLCECSQPVQKLFSRWHFRFIGQTKKIAYASGLEGEKVVPVQAITALVYLGVGLLCTWLFLRGNIVPAFMISIVTTQGWRVFSETLRADYRGEEKVSAYQWMGLAAIPYALVMPLFFSGQVLSQPEIITGLMTLWHPGTLLFLQLLWIILFIYTGRSSVTGSQLSFFIHEDRI